MQTRHTGSEGVGHAQHPTFLATIFPPVTQGKGSAPPAPQVMPATKKTGRSPGLILLCLLLLLSACHKKTAVEEVRPVRSVIVDPTPDTNGEVVTGQVAAHQSINLAFRLPGKVVERSVSAGSVVHAGDVLARLDDTVPQQTLRTALAENATARAALEQAAPLKQRAAALLPVEAISRNDYDDAVRRYKTAQDQVQATQAQVRVAQEQLGYTRLMAPEDGIVTDRLVEAGEVVAAGQPVLRMAANDGLDAQFRTAFKEVHDALLEQNNAHAREQGDGDKETAAEKTVELMQLRLEHGYASRLDVLSAQVLAQQAEQAHTTALLSSLDASVDMYRAIGGGFDTNTPQGGKRQ
ncbi:efflux RND transporter periplasmic adaptor subunit [Komagataeibacter europaeus]|uniref:efflux RND transporter periplasmic adaptor subunit n=1 Tax=Komagataeibacter europaeus TaxID=33995 RepID=UPI0021750C3E|nr:efflux RND transporter periplasmic adaptor subunit [Komagataeibacter europaeus]